MKYLRCLQHIEELRYCKLREGGRGHWFGFSRFKMKMTWAGGYRSTMNAKTMKSPCFFPLHATCSCHLMKCCVCAVLQSSSAWWPAVCGRPSGQWTAWLHWTLDSVSPDALTSRTSCGKRFTSGTKSSKTDWPRKHSTSTQHPPAWTQACLTQSQSQDTQHSWLWCQCAMLAANALLKGRTREINSTTTRTHTRFTYQINVWCQERDLISWCLCCYLTSSMSLNSYHTQHKQSNGTTM